MNTFCAATNSTSIAVKLTHSTVVMLKYSYFSVGEQQLTLKKSVNQYGENAHQSTV